MKYSINVYGDDGAIKATYGADFVSTNTVIKAVEALQKIEGKTDITEIVKTLAKVVTYLIPSLDEETVMNGCDYSDLLALVRQIVAKISDINPSKN